MPSRSGHPFRVAIVGASSLRGKELKQVLEDCRFPASDIHLYDETVLAGTLTEAAGELTFIRALDQASFEGVRFAFFAGTAADAQRNWQTAQRAGATAIDLTGALTASVHTADSAIAPTITWIPSLASVLAPRQVSGAGGASRPVAYSSPAAPVIIACTLAAGLQPFAPHRIVVLLFPPVSEHDQAGVEELESQTANLLTFREIAKPVFDAQVAFNLLAGYGEESKLRLADVRASIAREVAGYLEGRAQVPAIQLVQAPVFYGYSFAAYAELASPVPSGKLESAFAKLGVKIGARGEALPTNVSVAGESEIHLARVEPDPNVGSGVWLWGAADNLRLAATNAVRIAEELVAQSQPQ